MAEATAQLVKPVTPEVRAGGVPAGITTPQAIHESVAGAVAKSSVEAGHPTTPTAVLSHGESKAVLEKIQKEHPGAEAVGEWMHDLTRIGEQMYGGSHYINVAKPGRHSIVMERAKKLAGRIGKPIILQNLLSRFKKQKV